MAVSEYLQLRDGTDSDFVDLPSQEFDIVGRDSETPRAATRAWMISFEQVQQQNTLVGEHEQPGVDVPESGPVGRGREGGGGGDGDSQGQTRGRPSRHADEHSSR